jgi:hypothetical protein
VHVKVRSAGFLVEPQNQGRRFMSSLASKLLRWFSPFWPQNRWRRFSSVWPQNRWLRFPGLDLKTSSQGLVIWASKLPWWFLGLGLKTNKASICQLRHKTDGGRTARDTHRDLLAGFAWKQVALEFFSLASRLAEA